MLLGALVIGAYALGFFFVDVVNPDFKERFANYQLSAMLHVIPGGIVLIIGALQFNAKIRRDHTIWHRRLGKIYCSLVAVGAIAGFVIAFNAHGGAANKIGFGCLAILWLYSVTKAYLAIRQRDFTNHQRWMIRNYALTLAAVTLRIQLGGLQAGFGLSFDESYAIVSWLSWVPNLAIAEWFFVERLGKK